MTKKEKFLSGAVCAHLVAVCFGAASMNFNFLGPLARTANSYGDVTGASTGYGFFTNDIDSGLRAEFDVEASNGVEIARLETGLNREADLRIGNILGVLSRSVENEKLRRAVAASWAGKVLSRYPAAKSVTVRMENLPIPPMQAYSKGMRSEWKPFYVARFERGGKKP